MPRKDVGWQAHSLRKEVANLYYYEAIDNSIETALISLATECIKSLVNDGPYHFQRGCGCRADPYPGLSD